MTPIRLAVVVSHPIQHFVPFYRGMAADPEIQLKVFYCSRIGLKKYYDADMKTEISWAMDLLSGYDHEFLPEAEAITEATFSAVNNPSIGKALAEFRPDAALIYGWGRLTSLRALGWCQRAGVARLLMADSELLQKRAPHKRAAKAILMRALLPRFSAILTVGDNNERYYTHFGVPTDKLFRSPFTIDESLYRQARENRAALRAELRSAHGIREDEIVAVCVGKLSERKRPLDLVEAAAVLKQEGLSLRCMFAGNGELRQTLEARVGELGVDATLLGFVNVDKLPAVYAAADLLAHPSAIDPHPLVMSEAACIGLPLVVSDRVGAVGPTDIAQPAKNTRVFTCGDAPGMAAALKDVAFNPQRREAMAQASLDVFATQDLARSLAGIKAAARYALQKSPAR